MIAVLIYLAIIIVVDLVASIVLRGAFITTSSVTIDPNTGVVSVTGGSGFLTVMLVNALMVFLGTIFLAFLQAGIIRGALMIADGKRLEVGHMFNFDKFGTIIVAAVIVALATMVGFLLCFVGAVVVAFFTPFYLFFILDKNQGAWESIKSSIDLVTSNFAAVLLLFLAVIAAYVVGAILCLVGLLVTLPVAILAVTNAYRRLQNEPVAA